MKYSLNQKESLKISEAIQIITSKAVKSKILYNDPTMVANLVKLHFAELDIDVEHFVIVMLDNRHHLIETKTVCSGTIDQASIYPREIVKLCLNNATSAVILAHNHPSGHPEPSASDHALTKRLKDALALIDIRVLDHIIVTAHTHTSFAEKGWL